MENIDGKLRKITSTSDIAAITVNEAVIPSLSFVPDDHPDSWQAVLNHFGAVSKQMDGLTVIDPSLANIALTPTYNRRIPADIQRTVPTLLSTMVPSDDKDAVILFDFIRDQKEIDESLIHVHNENMKRIIQHYDSCVVQMRKKR